MRQGNYVRLTGNVINDTLHSWVSAISEEGLSIAWDRSPVTALLHRAVAPDTVELTLADLYEHNIMGAQAFPRWGTRTDHDEFFAFYRQCQVECAEGVQPLLLLQRLYSLAYRCVTQNVFTRSYALGLVVTFAVANIDGVPFYIGHGRPRFNHEVVS